MRSVHFTIFATLCLHICISSTIDRYRLPKNIRASHYKLRIHANPEETHFTGVVQITLDVVNGSSNILFLHADHNYISINSILLNGTSCNYSLFNDVAVQMFPVQCQEEFRSGQDLIISYIGKFANDMCGFYKSTHDNQILIATQFQPVYARRAFPCFDEPSFKATFEVILIHPAMYRTLSNTPLDVAIITRNSSTTQFQRTPKMSTYLLAFIISQFEPAYKTDQDFNVFARPSAANNMEIAKKYGPKLYGYMSQWTQIEYDDLGNPQQYLVGIPDFAAGAMENWGLINFREVDLLDDGDRTSTSSFRTILTVMGHEIAHQWFGNYVTLDWWSNTWLNEGFAEYFARLITDKVDNGTLEMSKQFVIDITQRIMEKDAVSSATPLSTSEKSIRTPLEIDTKFNEITYLKGSSIVRMMKYILGEQIFRNGVRNYLMKNKYENTNPEKLFEALQAAAGDLVENFGEKMYNWIYKSGFPLLTVLQKNKTALSVTQERFCVSKICTATEWFVPLSYTTGRVKNFSAIIKSWLKPNESVEIPHEDDDWFIMNIQEIGYYRVNYGDSLWDRIIQALNESTVMNTIDPLNRAQLIDDIFHIAKIGKISYEKAFSLSQYLKKETSYYPWTSAIRAFSYLIDNVDPITEKLLQEWLIKLLTEAFPDDTKYVTHVDKLKEILIAEETCKLGYEKCLSDARKQFNDFKENNILPDVDKEHLVFCYGLAESDNLDEDYKFMLDVFKESTSAHGKFVILSALGCMRDEELLTSYLNLTLLRNSPIREQDYATVFNSVYYNNKMGISVALNFMEKHFKNMEIAYGSANMLSVLLLDIAERVSSPSEIEKMNQIMNTHKESENIKLVGSTVAEIINANQQWKIEYANGIRIILEKQKNTGQRCSINFILILALILFKFVYAPV